MMTSEVTIGDRCFRISALPREGRWVATAERADTGDRFGVECAAESDAVAIERLARWLEWQDQHTRALEELQQAERAYHRNVATDAFASGPGERTPLEVYRDSLEAVAQARQRLDDIRAQRPL
jgi:hypothetical protein